MKKYSQPNSGLMNVLDEAAVKAEADLLKSVPQEAITVVANWWKAWCMSTGHRRLAKLLLKQIK